MYNSHEKTRKRTYRFLTFQRQKNTRHLNKHTQKKHTDRSVILIPMEEKLIQRLESAVSRLESLASGSRSQPQSVPYDAASASSDPSIVAFDDLVNEYVAKVTGAAEKIGGQVVEITNVLGQAFNAQKELLVKIKQTQVEIDQFYA